MCLPYTIVYRMLASLYLAAGITRWRHFSPSLGTGMFASNTIIKMYISMYSNELFELYIIYNKEYYLFLYLYIIYYHL